MTGKAGKAPEAAADEREVEARASAIAKRLMSMPPQPRKPAAKPAKKKGG